MDISSDKLAGGLNMATNFQRETESLLIVALNNGIRTNYIKIKIDYMQRNRKCKLCGERVLMVKHINKNNNVRFLFLFMWLFIYVISL